LYHMTTRLDPWDQIATYHLIYGMNFLWLLLIFMPKHHCEDLTSRHLMNYSTLGNRTSPTYMK
jgi:hypothetical protein